MMQVTSYSMGFTAEEKSELVALVASSPKWTARVNGAFGHFDNVPDEPWPKPLNSYDFHWLNKRVKVVRGDCEVSQPVCLGKTGTVTGFWDFRDIPSAEYQVILPASCYHMAVVSGDNGETFHANTSWCEVID